MTDSPPRAVLITGCSSGIGHATARRFVDHGWTVYATARRPDALAELEAAGCRTLALDVCDEASMAAAVKQVENDEGAVGVLVNNAGFSMSGPIEDVGMDEVRRQFDTNVFGLVRMCQLVLPGMREQGWGRIVNLSSMGGKLTFPGIGFYHGTKHAVEAISDALRYEVRPFGVKVIIIEPGAIKTSFGDTAVAHASAASEDGSVYKSFSDGVAKAIAGTYEGPMGAFAAGPDAVAKTIERAVSKSRPRPRYMVTAGARVLRGTHAVLSDRTWDLMMRTQFPSPDPTAAPAAH